MILVPFVPFILILGIGYYYFTTSLETSTISSMKRVAEDHRHFGPARINQVTHQSVGAPIRVLNRPPMVREGMAYPINQHNSHKQQFNGILFGKSNGFFNSTPFHLAVELQELNLRLLRVPRQFVLATQEPARPALLVVCAVNDVSFGQNIVIGKGEVIKRDVVVMGGSVTVEGTVKGDTVVMGGTLTIAGTVKGDAVVVGGTLILKPTAQIKGDTVCVGGKIQKESGASIEGDEVGLEFPFFDLSKFMKGVPFGPLGAPSFNRVASCIHLAQFVVSLVLACLIIAFLPQRVKNVFD